MNRVTLRTVLAIAAAAAVCVVMESRPGAAGRAGIPVVDRLVGTALNLTDNHPVPLGRIDIVIERWSTPEELERLRAHSGSAAQMLDALQEVRRRAGTLLSPGLQGLGTRSRDRRAQSILFAQQIDTPAGRRVVIATDKRLGFGDAMPDPKTWDGEQLTTDFEFTLFDIRFGPDGIGVGKMAQHDKVVYNQATKTFEIQDFAKQPERLTGVRSEKPQS
jgi:hypothetical protein